MRENREKLRLSNQDGVHLFVLLFVLVWIWHPDCSSCTMGQPRWFTSSLHQWVIHCHPAPPPPTHTLLSLVPMLSAHFGATQLLEDVHQAPSPWTQWDESQRKSRVHWASATWISGGDWKKEPVVMHCVHTLHTDTHSAIAETHSMLRTDRKFNKELCCTKSFILIQGKTYKAMFCSCQTMLVSNHFSLSFVIIGSAHLHVSSLHNSGRQKPLEIEKQKKDL